MKHLTYAWFPLSEKVWIAINEKHNRGGAAPDPDFGVFFGRKVLGHKLDKPDLAVTVRHLQELWIGMGQTLTKGNWHDVSLPIKHLSLLIQKYAERTCSQAERQSGLISKEQPARNVETASHVSTFDPPPISATLSVELCRLNMDLENIALYVRLEVNFYMKGLVSWQR